jgi:hypothetical protein
MHKRNLNMAVNGVRLRNTALSQRCIIACATARHHWVIHACGKYSAVRRAYDDCDVKSLLANSRLELSII